MTRAGFPSILIDMQYDGSELNYIAVDNYRGGDTWRPSAFAVGISEHCDSLWP